MRVGDLVKYSYEERTYGYGIVTKIDDSHRQTSVYVLLKTGIIGPIWENHLEVINEHR